MSAVITTYIDHSGFFLEWEDCCFLFDYYRGKLPEPKDKPLYIFSSHSHGDHFNPEIFRYGAKWGRTIYILSDEISVPSSAQGEEIHLLGGHQTLNLPGITVETLPSTDLGVAFLVTHLGRTVYHAGDLHWWLWDECTEAENAEMTQMFQSYTAPLKGRQIDIAFLPLDPRQEQYGWQGFDYYMRLANIQRAVPMHFWGDYSIIDSFCRRGEAAQYLDRIVHVTRKDEIYEL